MYYHVNNNKNQTKTAMAPSKFLFFTTVILISSPSSCLDLNFTGIFNFGDSNSDTGNLVAGIGEPLNPPNGQSFFRNPSGRFCDGRLIIDFLADAFNVPFLDPYLDSLGRSDFKKGCNFAAAGSTILPPTQYSVSPFSFRIQVKQFLRFRSRVFELHEIIPGYAELSEKLPKREVFDQALYMFDIGQNDLAGAFYSKSEDQVISSIPTILDEFEAGLQELYESGARKFWVQNTGPLGCLPQNIVLFGKDRKKLDEIGCVVSHNKAARLFNLQLHALCLKLKGQLLNATIVYLDVFSIKLDMITNYSKYGFEHPIAACCGYGGPPLNYDNRVSCGRSKKLDGGSTVTTTTCSDTTEYVDWDGIHYTEAANFHVAYHILSGKYSDPPFADKMPFLLKLKFQV